MRMNYNPYLANPQNFYGYQQAPQQNVVPQSSYVGVQSEQEARSYPVAPGNCVTFRDESAPYIYTKVMGYSPLDRPVFEKYRLVKEGENVPEKTEEVKTEIDLSAYALKSDLTPFTEQIAELRKELTTLKEKAKKRVIREVEVDDE